MGLGTFQEGQKIFEIFLQAVNGVGASSIPSLLPFFELLKCFGFILSQVDLPSIRET